MSENEITTKQIWFGILLVLLLTSGYFVANKYLDKNVNPSTQETQNLEKKIDNLEKILSPYQKKDGMKKFDLLNDFENTTANHQPTQTFEKGIFSSGKIEQGYLYVVASVAGKPLSGNDDIYIKVKGQVGNTYQELGGHLIKNKSLETPVSDDKTELLYDLTDVKYKTSYLKSDLEVVGADWLNLLNNQRTDVVVAFASTEGAGRIEQISFYYSCSDNSLCSLNFK